MTFVDATEALLAALAALDLRRRAILAALQARPAA